MKFPKPQNWSLGNGLRILYQQDSSFPLTSATLLFKGGSRFEKKGEAGLASITLDLLMQGTRRKDARAIARAMESVGASLGTQAHQDYSEIGFIAPATEIDRAIGLTAEVLFEPIFPHDEVVKEKEHIVASLASRQDAIFNIAYDHLCKAVFQAHPYGRPLEGDVAAVRSFQRDDFGRWHTQWLGAAGSVLSMTGPLPVDLIRKKLEATFGSWRKGHSDMTRRASRAPILTKSKRISVTAPFEQAYLMSAWQAPAIFDKDQVPFKVLNTLVGGGMSSRLFMTLREELGLAYEVSSFYSVRVEGSLWIVYLGLPAEKLKLASKKLDELLETLAAKGPTESELKQAKAMIRGAFLMDLQSHRRQGWFSAWWEFLDRGPSYGERFLKEVDRVTTRDLQKLMQKLLLQPRMTVTVQPK